MFWNILSIENAKILKRRMLWIEMAILAVLIIALYSIIYGQLQGRNMQSMPFQARNELLRIVTWPSALPNVLSFGGGNSLGGLLVIILTGAITAQEYTWRTMQLWLSRGLPRPMLLGAKFVAMLLPVIMFVATPLIVGGGLTAIFTLAMDKSLPFGQVDWWHLAMSVLRTAYTLLPYATLTFMLAIVTRSTAAAIGIGMAYTLLVEGVASLIFTLLGGVLRDIVAYLPGALAEGVLKLNHAEMAGTMISTGNGMSLIKNLDPIPAAIGIAMWTAFFFGVAVWSFRRKDMAD
jgi:ABC-type transport system involved in multi-copper enzyme maturation permease subunit